MSKQLLKDMVEGLEKQNSKLLLSPYAEDDYKIIMNKILHNLETIQLIKNNEVEGLILNGHRI